MTRRLRMALFALTLLHGGADAAAQTMESLLVHAHPASRVWLEGSTTLHAFSCSANTARAEFQLDRRGAGYAVAPGVAPVRTARVTVPVRGLKCRNSRMEQDLYRAVKADSFPSITFVLSTATMPAVSEGVQSVQVTGILSFAGVERPLSFTADVIRRADGGAVARGSTTILMTDHGVRPPTALRGLIRTADEVRVSFDARVTIPDNGVAADTREVVVLMRRDRPGSR